MPSPNPARFGDYFPIFVGRRRLAAHPQQHPLTSTSLKRSWGAECTVQSTAPPSGILMRITSTWWLSMAREGPQSSQSIPAPPGSHAAGPRAGGCPAGPGLHRLRPSPPAGRTRGRPAAPEPKRRSGEEENEKKKGEEGGEAAPC